MLALTSGAAGDIFTQREKERVDQVMESRNVMYHAWSTRRAASWRRRQTPSDNHDAMEEGIESITARKCIVGARRMGMVTRDPIAPSVDLCSVVT